jgi:hypothetical protein
VTRRAHDAGFGRRESWIELLATLTDGFVRSIPSGGSPAATRLPGAPVGEQVPSIEGFARMSVAWGAWLHEPSNPTTVRRNGRVHDVAALLARGLADATDPASDAWWGPIGDRDQRIVEAAEIATAISLGGDRFRDALDAIDPSAFDRVLDWLAGIDGKDLWPDNWVLFPVLPALVRRQAGRTVDLAAMDRALDWMVDHTVGDGWTSDGAGHALDLYSGWAIHWHLSWWAAINGDRRPRLAADVRRRARAWLRFVAPLVADDGGFPRFGRSLGYRFAIAAPFAQAALLGLDPLPPGVARTLAGRLVGHALEDGALHPTTDWFRIGVAGARPEVVEGYVSAGASAWAAHALVALAMPASHPFWSATVDRRTWDPPPVIAAASAGLLGARAAGITVLHNARAGHPADIADHDYAATYGKFAYRSAFPFDVPVVSGQSAGSDDALVAIEEDAESDADVDPWLAHRNESGGGSAGPGWITTRYVLPTRRPTQVRTIVVLIGGVEVRVHAVAGGSAISMRDGGAALGVDGDDTLEIEADQVAGIARVSGHRRVVAIRRLLGFDRVGVSETGRGRMNVVHDRSSHPWSEEGAATSVPRVVASATVAARRESAAAIRLLRALDVVRVDGGRLTLESRVRPAETAVVDVSGRSVTCLQIAGRDVHGPGLRVVLARNDGSAFGGERIASIDGVLTLARPGIVAVTHGGRWVETTVASGIRLDPSWAGHGLDRVRVREVPAAFGPPIELDERGAAPDRLVRGHARRLGTRLVTLRFERRA